MERKNVLDNDKQKSPYAGPNAFRTIMNSRGSNIDPAVEHQSKSSAVHHSPGGTFA